MGTPETAVVTGELSVDAVMRLWPGTIRIFLAYRMKCIGCPVGRLHTIEEACREHEVDLEAFLADLRTGGSAHQAVLSGPDDCGDPSASRNSL